MCANTNPQRACPPKPRRRRNSVFTKGPSDALDHATSEIASGSKLGIDADEENGRGCE
jgi:3-polyprenyl-4-hydroxybenzoate decarboxylase